MTAFSVEAFIQTIGPEVLPTTWITIERKSVLHKLKEIGKATGITVDYGTLPWNLIKELFDARNRLAHAKPADREFEFILEIPDGADEHDVLTAKLEEEFQPLHKLDKLDALAKTIDEALLLIWISAGYEDFSFTSNGMNSWSFTAE
ncbi:hypothetical protein [Dyella flagellata]|uniref:Apea-like HEPN domain-containing protein n=2 Tax=Dyella flagellata TaxID=1867833 RepID=A0ABQ5X8D9_9GAMM|nr:hypothetical protein [Dyella flagellata]GLQ87323.1 hypothetical protein GCM10007898_08890 [Dyella flagellata]